MELECSSVSFWFYGDYTIIDFYLVSQVVNVKIFVALLPFANCKIYNLNILIRVQIRRVWHVYCPKTDELNLIWNFMGFDSL